MRRTGVLAVVLVLGISGTALAVSYHAGTYSVGFPSTQAAGITLTIHRGSFSVQAMSFREHCAAGSQSINDYFEFTAGGSASIKGTISSTGKFSGKWVSSSGTDKVSGSVTGSKATVKGSERTTYQPNGSTAVFTCTGSATFHATRLQTTGG